MSKKAKIVIIVSSFLLVGMVVAWMAFSYLKNRKLLETPLAQSGGTSQPTTATWTSAVSGDSRNCGDVVVPTIAADAATHAPQFYWRLGDFRFIAMIDEDMRCKSDPELQRAVPEIRRWKDFQEVPAGDKPEAGKIEEWLSYEKHAWKDFDQSQMGAFDRNHIPVFLGIGNHEMILHNDHEDLIRTFKNRLNPDTQQSESSNINTHYHWIVGSVDFINLDNAGIASREKNLSFGSTQLDWLQDRLAKDATNPNLNTVVVGMHAALPDSISRSHSMNESEEGSQEENSTRRLARSKNVY